MNFRTTIIMVLIVAIGGSYIYFVERKQESAEDLEKASKKVVGIESLADKATRVRIQAEKGKTIGLERTGEGSDAKWVMNQPRELRADKSEVRSILSDLEFLEKKDIAPAGQADMDAWGLAAPRGRIGYTVDGKDHTLLIGALCPDNRNVWAMFEGGKEVYKVAKSIFDKAKKTVNDIREKKLFDVEKDNVSRLVLTYPDGTEIECAMAQTGWVLKKPVEDQGNKDEIDKIIDKIKDLRVDKDDFVADKAEKLADYGLDKPQLVAVVYQKDVSQTLLLGAKAEGKTDKIYAKRKGEDAIVAIKKSFIDDVKKAPKDLRDKKVASLAKEDVESAEIKVGDQIVALAKKDTKWRMSKPKDMEADTWETEDFFGEVGKLEVDEFVEDKPKDLAKYGLDKPAAEITLKLKDDKGERKIIIGAKQADGEKYYIKRAGQAPVLLVDAKSLVAKATSGYLAFRGRLVLEFSKSKAKKLTVKRKDKTFVAQINPDDDSKWDLLQPIKTAADKTEVDDILWDLSYLKAKVFVAEGPKSLKPYGLDAPAISVSVEYEKEVESEDKDAAKDGDKDKDKDKDKKKTVRETKTLLVGKKTKDNRYYAKLADSNLVFEMEESYYKNLNDELASKSILKVDKAKVKAISLAYAGKAVKVEKKGDDKWEMSKPKKGAFSKTDADDILDTLADWRASDIETYKAASPAKYGLDKPFLALTLDVDKGQKSVKIGAKKGEDKYYVQAGGSDFVFVVAKADVDKLAKEKPTAPAKAAPAKPAATKAPVKKAPAKAAPAKPAATKAPVKKAPAKAAPVKPAAKPTAPKAAAPAPAKPADAKK